MASDNIGQICRDRAQAARIVAASPQQPQIRSPLSNDGRNWFGTATADRATKTKTRRRISLRRAC